MLTWKCWMPLFLVLATGLWPFTQPLAAFCGQVLLLCPAQECWQDSWPPARTVLKYWSLGECCKPANTHTHACVTHSQTTQYPCKSRNDYMLGAEPQTVYWGNGFTLSRSINLSVLKHLEQGSVLLDTCSIRSFVHILSVMHG